MFRRIFPFLVVALPVACLVGIRQLEAREIFPEAIFPLMMGFMFSAMFAIIAVPVWFWFFSKFSRTTKLVGTGIGLACLAALIGSIRKVEFRGGMSLIAHFRWEPDLDARVASYLEGGNSAETTLSPADIAASPEDFPRYRGQDADGVARWRLEKANWTEQQPKIAWIHPAGHGHSGVAVAGRLVVTQEQRRKKEAIVAYDRDTGKEIWAVQYDAEFTHTENMGGGGPRATPTIADGDVYAVGALGDLYCVSADKGEVRWNVNILKDNDAKNIEWAMTGSPLIVDHLVIVNPGVNKDDNKKQALAAYDRKTGKKVWASGEHVAGYSSPMVATLAGIRQIVLFDAGGLAGFAIADGKELWRYEWKTQFDMNVIQPLVLPGDKLFISSEQTPGGVVVQVSKSGESLDQPKWSVTKVWQNRKLAAGYANPVFHKGHIYGLSTRAGILTCLNAETGERLWQSDDRFGTGQVLLSGDVLIVQSESPEVATVAADPAAYRVLGRFAVPNETREWDRVWNTPALASGRLFLRNHRAILCLDVR